MSDIIMVDAVHLWAEGLAPNRDQQIHVIEDLLKHANEDDMSQPDRTFCVQALSILKNKPVEVITQQHQKRNWTRVCAECGSHYTGAECPQCEDLTI